MKVLQAALALFLLSTVAHADPVEVVLASSISGVKDSRSLQNYVLKGNKARVYAKVQIHAKGYSNQGLRQWLERRLPTNVDGFFEREDRDSGLSVRYKPVAFKLRKAEIFCTGGATPEYEVCHADYAVSNANAVDIPGGEGGEHVVTLQMLPPANDFRVKMSKGATKNYFVLAGDPKLSRFGFAGGSDH